MASFRLCNLTLSLPVPVILVELPTLTPLEGLVIRTVGGMVSTLLADVVAEAVLEKAELPTLL